MLQGFSMVGIWVSTWLSVMTGDAPLVKQVTHKSVQAYEHKNKQYSGYKDYELRDMSSSVNPDQCPLCYKQCNSPEQAKRHLFFCHGIKAF